MKLIVLFCVVLISFTICESILETSEYSNCSNDLFVLEKALYGMQGNKLKLINTFYPSRKISTAFVKVNYNFEDEIGEFTDNCSATYWWTAGGFLLVLPPTIFRFSSLFFGNKVDNINVITLTLPYECRGVVTDDKNSSCSCYHKDNSLLDVLTQQLRLYAKYGDPSSIVQDDSSTAVAICDDEILDYYYLNDSSILSSSIISKQHLGIFLLFFFSIVAPCFFISLNTAMIRSWNKVIHNKLKTSINHPDLAAIVITSFFFTLYVICLDLASVHYSHSKKDEIGQYHNITESFNITVIDFLLAYDLVILIAQLIAFCYLALYPAGKSKGYGLLFFRWYFGLFFYLVFAKKNQKSLWKPSVKDESDIAKGRYLWVLIFSLLAPTFSLAGHFTYILMSWLIDSAQATSVALVYIGTLTIFFVIMRQCYETQKKKKFCSQATKYPDYCLLFHPLIQFFEVLWTCGLYFLCLPCWTECWQSRHSSNRTSVRGSEAQRTPPQLVSVSVTEPEPVSENDLTRTETANVARNKCYPTGYIIIVLAVIWTLMFISIPIYVISFTSLLFIAFIYIICHISSCFCCIKIREPTNPENYSNGHCYCRTGSLTEDRESQTLLQADSEITDNSCLLCGSVSKEEDSAKNNCLQRLKLLSWTSFKCKRSCCLQCCFCLCENRSKIKCFCYCCNKEKSEEIELDDFSSDKDVFQYTFIEQSDEYYTHNGNVFFNSKAFFVTFGWGWLIAVILAFSLLVFWELPISAINLPNYLLNIFQILLVVISVVIAYKLFFTDEPGVKAFIKDLRSAYKKKRCVGDEEMGILPTQENKMMHEKCDDMKAVGQLAGGMMHHLERYLAKEVRNLSSTLNLPNNLRPASAPITNSTASQHSTKEEKKTSTNAAGKIMVTADVHDEQLPKL